MITTDTSGTPAIDVVVLPDSSERAFPDDTDPGDVVFRGRPILQWHDSYLAGRSSSPGWVLDYETEPGNPDDHFVGGQLDDLEWALSQARAWLKLVAADGGQH